MATSNKKDVQEEETQDSDDYYSIICLPCHRDNSTLPAFGYCIDCKEHLCHGCYKHHQKATPSRHHNLQDKHAMPTTNELTDVSVHAGPGDNIIALCPRHKTEMIKLYCNTHDVMLCSVCVALGHTKPCRVDYIPDISEKAINGKDYKRTMDWIQKLLEKCAKTKYNTSKYTDKSDDSLNAALQDILTYRNDINKRFDKIQLKLQTKITDLKDQNSDRKNTVSTICNDITKKVQIIHHQVKKLNTAKQANQLFIELKQAIRQLQDYDGSIDLVASEDESDEYVFVPNHVVNDLLLNESILGDIAPKVRGSIPVPLTHTVPLLMHSYDALINVKTVKDKETCMVRDMISLPHDRLALTDWNNNSIKLFDVSSKSLKSHLSFGKDDSDKPWAITIVSQTEIAATLPGRQRIEFIKISNKLSKSRTLETNADCYGLYCHQDKLVVAYRNPGKLEIIDYQGSVLTKDKIGIAIDSQPGYVVANSKAIYVSDSVRKEIIMVNWQGAMTGRFGNIGTPAGLALLGDGSLLASDYYNDAIIQISGDLKDSRRVLQHVRCPSALCVNKDGDKAKHLHVGRWTHSEEYIDNNIVLYNFIEDPCLNKDVF